MRNVALVQIDALVILVSRMVVQMLAVVPE